MKAQIEGQLSGFDLNLVRQSAAVRLLVKLMIPIISNLKVNIDEFYLNRVDLGQTGVYVRPGDNEEFNLRIKKIYPDVQNNQFKIDMVFTDEQPEDIRRGQTLQSKLTLGDSSEAILFHMVLFIRIRGQLDFCCK